MDVVYATTTARIELPGGGPGMVHKGTHWPAGDPVVREHPDMFSDNPRYGLLFSEEPPGYRDLEPAVEQATANPGERRATRRASNG